MPPSPAVFFVSDAHLGAEPAPAEAERAERLHRFFAWLPEVASTLYIAGDLFDFWFEYRTAIPRRLFPTLCALRRLRAAGVELHYLTGNHDFWLGDFLAREIGVHRHPSGIDLTLQGRRIYLHHGDGLVGGDLGYRVLRRVLRNPASIALYRLLHPDLGIPLAHAVSRLSRRSKGDRPLEPVRLLREVAEPRFAAGYDTVVIGHFHHSFERREPGREFFLLGDWIRHFTYLKLQDGEFTLASWEEAAQLPPS
jgi:UDP-2,3-diacylglucosamine hydrolase